MTHAISRWPPSPLARAAVIYADRGVAVLPLVVRGKRPHPTLAPHGVYSASADPKIVRATWLQAPDANIGIAISGPRFEGVRVLDVDPRHGGDRELARLEGQHAKLPDTLRAVTGSGGAHVLLAFPKGEYLFKLARGLELLGNGRYIVAAPSLHPSGAAYRWASTGSQIAPAPEWLVELGRADVPETPGEPLAPGLNAPDLVERARRYLAKCEPAISGSGGHTTTFLVAQKLVRGFGLDEATALRLLVEDYNPRCQPPWSIGALRRKVVEAVRRGRMANGALRDAPRRAS